jgi:hypothetical protein
MDEIKKSQKIVEYVEKEWIYLEYDMCTFVFNLMVPRSFGDSNFLQIFIHFLYLMDNCLGLPVKDAGGIILRSGD